MLAVLFASFPASSADADAMTAGYMLALENQHAEVVEVAVTAFIRGQDIRADKRFVPSAAELVLRCNATPLPEPLQRRLAAGRPALPKPVAPPPISDEERQRVGEKLKALAADLGAKIEMRKAAERPEMDAFGRANRLFDRRRAVAAALNA